MTELKQCNTCGQEKAANRENFTYFPDGRLRPRCRTCKQAADRRAAETRRPQREQLPEGMKRCTKCKVVKPATSEYYGAHSGIKSGLQPSCRECLSAWHGQHYQANRDAISEKRQEYMKRPGAKQIAAERARIQRKKDPGRYRGHTRAWAAKNKEYLRDYYRGRFQRLKQEDPEKLREKRRLDYLRNPEMWRAAAARRRARLLELGEGFDGQDLRRIMIAQQFKCFYCDTKLRALSEPWHADHFIPLARGGTNLPENIVIACAQCNLSKGKKMPWEWRPERFSPPPIEGI